MIPVRNDYSQWESLNEVSRPADKWKDAAQINEVGDLSAYNISTNINDGWSTLDFMVECRVNGVKEDVNEVWRPAADLLSQSDSLNENFSSVDHVSVEMFNRVHGKAMRRLYEGMAVK